MSSSAHVLHLSHAFRSRFKAGTTVFVLPKYPSTIAEAARIAGMDVSFRPASKWPFPDLMDHLSRNGIPDFAKVGWEEIARHNAARDHIADGLRAVPGGAAIIEVRLIANASSMRADADIVSNGARVPGAAQQAFFEVKTGTYSEIRINQQYVYALTLVGGHVTSSHPQLALVGLSPNVPLPPMDFVLIDVLPSGAIEPALILASQVDRVKTLELVMGSIAALEARR